MSDQKKDTETGYQRIIDALGESLFAASDEEILEEARMTGENPTEVAKNTKAYILSRLEEDERSRLQGNRGVQDQFKKEQWQASIELPESPEDRRSLLEKILNWMPQFQPAMLTIQYREMSNMSDGEVTECLLELADIGALDDFKAQANE